MMHIGFYMGVSVEEASCMAHQLQQVRGGIFLSFWPGSFWSYKLSFLNDVD